AHAASDAKIGDLQLAALVYHQVRRLKIAMNDAREIVCVIERIAQLGDPFLQFFRLEHLLRFVGAEVGKRIAINVFHRDTTSAFVIGKIVDAHNVLVRQLEAASGFTLQVCEHASIEDQQLRQKFE